MLTVTISYLLVFQTAFPESVCGCEIICGTFRTYVNIISFFAVQKCLYLISSLFKCVSKMTLIGNGVMLFRCVSHVDGNDGAQFYKCFIKLNFCGFWFLIKFCFHIKSVVQSFLGGVLL